MRLKRLALAFPGQGSQRARMGADIAKEFSAARHVFAEAHAPPFALVSDQGPLTSSQVDEALSQHLSRTMFEALLKYFEWIVSLTSSPGY